MFYVSLLMFSLQVAIYLLLNTLGMVIKLAMNYLHIIIQLIHIFSSFPKGIVRYFRKCFVHLYIESLYSLP